MAENINPYIHSEELADLAQHNKASPSVPDRVEQNERRHRKSLRDKWWRFPIEPIRTLDAIHLATALEFLTPFPDLVVLSLDERIIGDLDPLGLLKLSI